MNISKITWLILLVNSLMCASAQGVEPTDSEQHCGTSTLNGISIQKRCLQNDYIAKKITYSEPSPMSKFFANVVSGGHGYLAGGHSSGTAGLSTSYSYTELDMQGHLWDFSKQDDPSLRLGGHDSVINNGLIHNVGILIGSNSYFTPNFAKGTQRNNLSIKEMGFLYADNYFDCKKRAYDIATCKGREKYIENLFLTRMDFQGSALSLNSWGGGIHNSQMVLKNNISIEGSKATILNNQVWANAELVNNKRLFTLQTTNQSKLIDKSSQIFPDRTDDNTAIPSVLYVKFSPDTVIDGNTFTLMHKNDQAYAIVLDHSLRVRITNNTFNGFNVPILMDQWSSIVDNEGNVLNPDQFSGEVEMNRKGDIVKK